MAGELFLGAEKSGRSIDLLAAIKPAGDGKDQESKSVRYRLEPNCTVVPLEPGQSLESFRLVAPLGQGGMGIVWRALDTTLDREVALKVLPEAFAADGERLERFEREAKLLASLNHPNIATLYGLHEAGGVRFLTMELLAGESLDARIARDGALPPVEVWPIAAQIAMALEAAHEQGVVHRDLKPANIQLGPDGRVKVLDFGLAKSLARSAPGSDPSTPPSLDATRTLPGTRVGTVLGTPAYMSPEQARGKPVDRRTDIWAFGCVVIEMLTGESPFAGETVSDSIARILEREPPLSTLPDSVSSSIRRLLRHCLEKDIRRRQRDIGDALLVLEDTLEGRTEELAPAAPPSAPSLPPTANKRGLALIAAVALGVALGAVAIKTLRPATPPAPVRRFSIPAAGLEGAMSGAVYPSPDGTRIAWVADSKILVRDLDRLEERQVGPQRLSGRTAVVWSPDGTRLGYEHEGKLWRVPVSGGEPEALCTLPETATIIDASWGKDDRIAFSVWRGSLYEVPAAGGQPSVLVEADQDTVIDYHSVEWLPDGTLMFTEHPAGEVTRRDIVFLRDGKTRRVDFHGTMPTYSSTRGTCYTPLVRAGTYRSWRPRSRWPTSRSPALLCDWPRRAGPPESRREGCSSTPRPASQGPASRGRASNWSWWTGPAT